MVSEKVLKDSTGRAVGYELKGTIIDVSDYGVVVDVRPARSKSVQIKIESFDGPFEGRPHASKDWDIGREVKVLVVGAAMPIEVLPKLS